jgi:hypothetical protein
MLRQSPGHTRPWCNSAWASRFKDQPLQASYHEAISWLGSTHDGDDAEEFARASWFGFCGSSSGTTISGAASTKPPTTFARVNRIRSSTSSARCSVSQKSDTLRTRPSSMARRAASIVQDDQRYCHEYYHGKNMQDIPPAQTDIYIIYRGPLPSHVIDDSISPFYTFDGGATSIVSIFRFRSGIRRRFT